MPCVYTQAVRVAIGVGVGVVGAEEAGIQEIVAVEGLRGSDMMVAVCEHNSNELAGKSKECTS
jgi:hypothetical protein